MKTEIKRVAPALSRPARAGCLIVLLLTLVACSGGGGGGDSGGASDTGPAPAGSSNWDQLIWDQDNWA